jgi:hypothetical protein
MRGFGFHLKAGGLNSRSHDEGSTRGCFAGLRKPGTLVYGYAGQQTGVLSLLEMSSGSRTLGGRTDVVGLSLWIWTKGVWVM